MDSSLVRLHRLLVERYSSEDLRTLCFDLGVNYDVLGGEGLRGKARELILTMGRQRQFDRLLTQIARTRPDLAGAAVLSTGPDNLKALYAGLPAFEVGPGKARRRALPLVLLALLVIVVVAVVAVALLAGQNGEKEVQAPHAPPIERESGEQLFDEQTRLFSVPSGETKELEVMELWSAPEGTPVDCTTGYLRFTWQVREPYPQGGDELEIQRYIPMGGGRTEVVARGGSGSASEGWCGTILLYNNSLVDYQVEIRYASGAGR